MIIILQGAILRNRDCVRPVGASIVHIYNCPISSPFAICRIILDLTKKV
ncbi:MAG: hypothetical protein ACTSR3_06930 [Candidatus Helarchaeota archaeon]